MGVGGEAAAALELLWRSLSSIEVYVSCLQRNLAKAALESLACGRRRAFTTCTSWNGRASGSPGRVCLRTGGRGCTHHELWPAHRPPPATRSWPIDIQPLTKPCLAAYCRMDRSLTSSQTRTRAPERSNAGARCLGAPKKGPYGPPTPSISGVVRVRGAIYEKL